MLIAKGTLKQNRSRQFTGWMSNQKPAVSFSLGRSRALRFIALLGWLCVQVLMTPQAANSQNAPPEAGAFDKLNLQPDVAKQFVGMVFAGCPDRSSVFWETYGDPESPIQCPRTDPFFQQPTRTCRVVVEYKDMHFATREEPLSPADRANGVQWKGFLTDNWTISRLRWISNNSWGPWSQWSDTGNGRANDMVEFIKTNGQWSVGVTIGGGLMQALPIGFNNDIRVKPQRKVPSCADAMNDAAHPEGTNPVNTPLPTPTIRQRNAPTYQGNVGAFHQALQVDIDRSARDWGLAPHSFDKEVEYIYAAARLCASITPQMFAGIHQDDSLLQPFNIDRKYTVCDRGYHGVTAAVRSYDHTTERGLVMTIAPQGNWRAGKGIVMRIMFSGLAGDNVTASDLFSYYGVVQASLDMHPLPPGAVIDFPQPELSAASANPIPPNQKNADIPGDVATGMLLQRVDPVYPMIAKAAHVTGAVMLEVTVSQEGMVANVRILNGPAMLQQAALDAVRKWRYKPYLINNTPTGFRTTVSVTFPPGN